MSLIEAYRNFRKQVQSFGAPLVYRALFWRALNRLIPCRAPVAMVLDKVDPADLELPPGFRSGFVGAKELTPHIGAPGFYFTRESLERAEQRGDECYATFDGDRLSSLGYYSVRPTVVDGYPVSFNPGLVYMHHGYTHPDYRGKRLHPIGMARALLEYQKRGIEMIISDVDARNLSSLKSVYRLGYRNIGMIYIFHPFGKHFIWATRGCRERGFRFSPPKKEAAGVDYKVAAATNPK